MVVRVPGGRRRAVTMTLVTQAESKEAGERMVRQICRVRERHGYGERPHETLAQVLSNAATGLNRWRRSTKPLA